MVPQISKDGRRSSWIALLNLAGSVASITGITLLMLGTTLKTASFARILSTLIATILSFGIATTILLLLLEAHRIFRLRLRSKLWVFAMWMTGGSLGFVALLYLWSLVFKWASPAVEKLLQDLFGLR